MRNLKKSLAFVLVLALTLTTFVGAAFTDVAADNDYSTEISMLNDLGVLTGYPDNTFRPEGAITRNEAAAVVYRMLSGKTSADNFKGATKFSDISADHWASGYVNYASENGIITGYPDGTFKGDQQVTFAEYATMLVRALGLDPNGTASYPFGFISIADREKITADVDLIANDAALRGAVAKMTYNAIIDANYAAVATANNDYTVGEYVFGLKSVTGILTQVGKLGNPSNDEDEIVVETALSGGTNVISGDEYVADPSLFGQKVKVWFKGDYNTAKTAATSVDKIYAVVATGDSKTVTVQLTNIKSGVGTSNIDYKLNGVDKTLTLETGVVAYVNGKLDSTGANANAKVADALAGFNTKVTKTATFIDSDNDKEYDLVMVDQYVFAKVTYVTSKAIYLDTTVSADSGATVYLVNPNDEDESYDVTYPSDIAKDDYVLVKVSDTGDRVATVIATDKLTGTVTARSGSDYTIDGTTYTLGANIADLSVGSKYEYYVATDAGYNYIVKASGTTAAEDYLVITSTSRNYDSFADLLKVKVALADGTTKAMQIDVSADNKPNLPSGTAFQTPATDTNMVPGLYKYTVDDDGYIDTLSAVDTSSQNVGNSDPAYNKDGKTLTVDKAYQVNSTSVIFVIKNDGTAKVYTGSIPTYSSDANTVYMDLSDTSTALPKIKAAAIFLGANDSLSAGTDNNGVIGFVKGLTVNSVEDNQYTITYTIATQGEYKAYTTEAISQGKADQWDNYDKSFMKFDIAADGTITNITSAGGTTFDEGTFSNSSADGLYTDAQVNGSGSSSVVLAKSAQYDLTVGDNIALASDVKVYVIGKDNTGSVDAVRVGSIGDIRSSALKSGISGALNATYDLFNASFVYDTDDDVITAVYMYEDATSATITAGNPTVTAASITSDTALSITSDTVGTVYYLVQSSTATAPTAAYVRANGVSKAVGTANVAITPTISDLAAGTYKLYVVAETATGLTSPIFASNPYTAS